MKAAAGDAGRHRRGAAGGHRHLGRWPGWLRGESLEVRRALAMRLPARLGKRLLPDGGHPPEAATAGLTGRETWAGW